MTGAKVSGGGALSPHVDGAGGPAAVQAGGGAVMDEDRGEVDSTPPCGDYAPAGGGLHGAVREPERATSDEKGAAQRRCECACCVWWQRAWAFSPVSLPDVASTAGVEEGNLRCRERRALPHSYGGLVLGRAAAADDRGDCGGRRGLGRDDDEIDISRNESRSRRSQHTPSTEEYRPAALPRPATDDAKGVRQRGRLEGGTDRIRDVEGSGIRNVEAAGGWMSLHIRDQHVPQRRGPSDRAVANALTQCERSEREDVLMV